MDEKIRESQRFQEEAKKLADVLWAGRDDSTAKLLREGVKAMIERDYLLVKSTRECPECGGLDSMLARCFRCGATYGGEDMSKAEPEPLVELTVNGPHGKSSFQVPREALEGSPVMEEMRRHDDVLAAKAKRATATEEKALADFTGALEEVRGKLCTATQTPSDTPWEKLVPAVEAMNHLVSEVSYARDEMVAKYNRELEARVVACDERDRATDQAKTLLKDRDEAQEAVRHLQAEVEDANDERDSQILAMRVLAGQITEADKVIRTIMGAPALGGDPEYASDFVEQARVVQTWVNDRSEAYGKQRDDWEATEGKLRAVIENLEDDMRDIRQGDAGQAAEWKQTFWTLAARLGVPREMMGQTKSPNADGVMKYIDRVVLPALQVEQRVKAVETHIESQQAEAPEAGSKPPKGTHGACEHCGVMRPLDAAFCPSCAKE